MIFQDIAAAIALLAALVCGEAGAEPYAGQVAVAQVVENRTRSQHFPNAMVEVIWQPLQFSAANDQQLYAWGPPTHSCQQAAHQVITSDGHDQTNGALFYHADYIMPNWAQKMRPRAIIGKHVFY